MAHRLLVALITVWLLAITAASCKLHSHWRLPTCTAGASEAVPLCANCSSPPSAAI